MEPDEEARVVVAQKTFIQNVVDDLWRTAYGCEYNPPTGMDPIDAHFAIVKMAHVLFDWITVKCDPVYIQRYMDNHQADLISAAVAEAYRKIAHFSQIKSEHCYLMNEIFKAFQHTVDSFVLMPYEVDQTSDPDNDLYDESSST